MRRCDGTLLWAAHRFNRLYRVLCPSHAYADHYDLLPGRGHLDQRLRSKLAGFVLPVDLSDALR